MPAEYRAVWGDQPDDLERKVNALLAEGWQLQGGIYTKVWAKGLFTRGLYFFQAMVKP